MTFLKITWHDYDDNHYIDDVWTDEYEFDSRDEALAELDRCDGEQFEGHEIVKYAIY